MAEAEANVVKRVRTDDDENPASATIRFWDIEQDEDGNLVERGSQSRPYAPGETVGSLVAKVHPDRDPKDDDYQYWLKMAGFDDNLQPQLDRIIAAGGKFMCIDNQDDGTIKTRQYIITRINDNE